MKLPFHDVTTGATAELVLAPTKIVGVGVNYRLHAAEMGKSLPSEPLLFLKPPSALLAPGGTIERPMGYERVDFEGELGVVIASQTRHVAPSRALEHVRGYVCVNDVSCRDLQTLDGQWARAKGFDSFCPVGPRVVAGLDPQRLRITSRVNGQVRQDSSTSDMIFGIAALVSFISRHMTLEEGDLITTGTPSGVGNLAPGDEVEIEIEGIGVLKNRVAAAEAPLA